MIEIDKSLSCKGFFKYREEVLKTQKMGKLESKIDKFLSENKVKYHRQFIVRIGNRNKKRYAVSFYLSDKHIFLDMVDDNADMSLYDPNRALKMIFSNIESKPMILPINENLSWRDVKKQLSMLIK